MTHRITPRQLNGEDIRFAYDASGLDFTSTQDLDPLQEIVGQPRALQALDLGLGIEHATYNIYVAGLSGTGKKEMIRRALNERVQNKSAPADWIYVNNFDEADRPIAIDLEAGKGVRFQRAVDALIQRLRDELPKAFREEDFGRVKMELQRKYEEGHKSVFEELQKAAREKGFTVQYTQDGQITMVPIKDDRPMTREELDALSDEEKEALGRRQHELAEEVEPLFSKGRELNRRMGTEVRKVEHEFATRIIEPLVDDLRREFDHQKLRPWYKKLTAHIVEHLDRFRQTSGEQPQIAQVLGVMQSPNQAPFLEYKVNVLVDNGGQDKAPVIIEEAPNFKNLFGAIGGTVDRFGRVSSDFTKIRAGSLLRANGGYLVLNLVDALIEPLVWKELKRSIKSGHTEFHAYDPLGVFTASAIRPEPIPLNVKLVVIGTPLLYHLLHIHDLDFADIFKVKADFATEMPIDNQTGRLLGRFVHKLASNENALPFEPKSVEALIRVGARMAGDRDKITTEFSRLADIVREASYWARKDGGGAVQPEHVLRVTQERIYRANLIAERIRELIHDGVLLVTLEGEVVGQVNGLALIDLGDYAFGRPSRVTASVGVGASGLINIERESKLSGRTFDKAMLIIEGYLRNTYAGKTPIALSASLAMEQSYGLIEGDSASVAEVLCLLSALAKVPLRQGIAVTGSINQWGEVQAVGGINEKIEGFFDVCRQTGMNGEQGVCIPASNVQHLVLREDVEEAVEQGTFSLWAVEAVDEAIALFTGTAPGAPGKTRSFHGKVARRLHAMADQLKAQRVEKETQVVAPPSSPGPPDPRPPLPGRE